MGREHDHERHRDGAGIVDQLEEPAGDREVGQTRRRGLPKKRTPALSILFRLGHRRLGRKPLQFRLDLVLISASGTCFSAFLNFQ